jgi:hypothetical protein
MRLPNGLSPGKKRRAKFSLTITTGGEAEVS